MTNSQSVEQDGIIAGNIFAMLDNANRGVNRMKFISLTADLGTGRNADSSRILDFAHELNLLSSKIVS